MQEIDAVGGVGGGGGGQCVIGAGMEKCEIEAGMGAV
jgi:hypothetical protein